MKGVISMSQAAEQLKSTEQMKSVDIQTITAVKNGTNELVRYSIQLAMLNRLLSQRLITEKEHHKVNEQLRHDYGIASTL